MPPSSRSIFWLTTLLTRYWVHGLRRAFQIFALENETSHQLIHAISSSSQNRGPYNRTPLQPWTLLLEMVVWKVRGAWSTCQNMPPLITGRRRGMADRQRTTGCTSTSLPFYSSLSHLALFKLDSLIFYHYFILKSTTSSRSWAGDKAWVWARRVQILDASSFIHGAITSNPRNSWSWPPIAGTCRFIRRNFTCPVNTSIPIPPLSWLWILPVSSFQRVRRRPRPSLHSAFLRAKRLFF